MKKASLESVLNDFEVRISELEALTEKVRSRLNTLLPERHYCPKCKALISPLSEVCGSCGKVLRLPTNPKAGQPR